MASGSFDSEDSISIAELMSGSFQFKVNYWQTQDVGSDNCITSPVFNIRGHEWIVRFYPAAGRGYATNLFVHMDLELRGVSKNVSAIFDFGLFDKDGKPSFEDWSEGHHHRWSWKSHTFEGNGSTSGWYQFIKITELREKCLQDGCFSVVCTIIVLSADCTGSKFKRSSKFKHSASTMPLWSLPHHIGQLLDSKEGVDVTFDVGGKLFNAHRLILASRSPVFKAQLFGPLNETDTQKNIVINEIEPCIFQALLHFIYTDSLLVDIYQDQDCNLSSSIIMTRHLLEAADRYAIDKLKSICEEKLSKCITDETVATTLALAEQHNSPQLKALCINYATSPKNFVEIALTDGFAHLLLSCPAVVKELREKLKKNPLREADNDGFLFVPRIDSINTINDKIFNK